MSPFRQLLKSKLFRFLAVGVPAFAVALPVNAFLVEVLAWPKPAAYALVLLLQVAANFVLCRHFVFPEGRAAPWMRQFLEFMGAILAFRCLDWALYSLLTQRWPNLYISIQIGNVMLFAILKFAAANLIFSEKQPRNSRSP